MNISIKRSFIFLVTIFFSCFAFACLLGNFDYLPKISLGLDLKGGSSILFGADESHVLESCSSDLINKIKVELRSNGIKFKNIKKKIDISALSGKSENAIFSISFNVLSDIDDKKLKKILSSVEKNISIEILSSSGNNRSVNIVVSNDILSVFTKRLMNRCIDVLSKRVNEFGTTEAVVMSYGDFGVLVQVPNVFDIEKIRSVLGKTAQLKFAIVRDVIRLPLNEQIPGTFIAPSSDHSHYYILESDQVLDGDRLVNADVAFGQQREPVVSFKFDAIGSDLFASITANNVGKMLAILFDGIVISAPRINVAILGGSGIIQGDFSLQSASDMALTMRSGALPVNLEVLEEKIIGAGLGEESIKMGAIASILSILLVMFCMIVMYKLVGLFVCCALFMNLGLMLFFLILFQITLTLPGLAGIAITIGMAVDANILINERIKELLNKGRETQGLTKGTNAPVQTNVLHVLNAIDLGYKAAMKTIVDSNLTTIIGAVSLIIFGSGPIKGFGINLIIGLLVSMFTSVVFCRELIKFFIESRIYKNIKF